MKKIVVILFAFFVNSIFAQETEKRLALVIGNANYDKGELKNPVNDARLIASTLDSLDFDVILKENLETQTDFKRAILEFGKKRPSYNVAFVYYAGHGVQINDENYLLPTREEFSSENEVEILGVSVQDVMKFLKSQTNEVNILVLDACRDNPFESNWNTTRSLKSKGLAKIPPPTGSLIAFSTDSGQTAPDGDGENSVYTVSLAKNMLLEDTSIDQVFRNVRAEVLTETDGNQRPVEATQLTGQTFYLNPTKVSELLKDIQDLLDEEKYDEARSLIEPIYSKNSYNIEVLKLRFLIFKETSKNSRALDDINRLIEIRPNSSLGYRNRAALYAEKLDDYEKAEADYTKAIELEPENYENYYSRGEFYADYLEDYDKAIKDLSKAIELDPDDIYNYFSRGIAYGKNQQYNQSAADFLKIEEVDKDESFAKSDYLYNNLALTFEYLEQYDRALEYYTKEINLRPNYSTGYRNRAALYAEKLDDYEKAEADYIKAIELEPENDKNYYSRGKFYSDYLEDYDKAIKDLSKAIELDPDDIYNYFSRGLVYERNQQYNRSIADYLKIEEVDKDESFAKSEYLYNNLAISFENLEQYNKALEYYTKEINISPDAPPGYRNRAALYAEKLDDYEKAEADYTKAIELEPENDKNYYSRGKFYSDYLEDYDKAIKDLSKAIELNPEDPYNYFYRGLAYYDNQQYNNAITDYLKVIEINNEIVSEQHINLNIAINYREIGDYNKALSYYNKEIELKEDALSYSERAIFYYSFVKDVVKAGNDFKKALSISPDVNNIILKYMNFLKNERKYDDALKLIKENKEIDKKDPQPDFVAALIYFELDKPHQAVKYLGICLEKIKKYSSDGYWISDINDNEIDLSKPFVMMGNFFKGKDDEMMCDYYSDGLNYTKDEKIKNEINTLIADNCNDITELNQKN